MRTWEAAAGSSVFFALAPGTVAGFVPWLITRWDATDSTPTWLRIAGAVVVVLAAGFLVQAFVRFVVEGFGTPAPVAPPETLVVGGIYRFVRNPMYVAVFWAIVGQAMLLGRAGLLWWAGIAGVAMVTFVKVYEEPALRGRFGADYEEYCHNVPGWRPRSTPWRKNG